MSQLLKNKAPEYPYSPLAYHDTWLSVDPIIGCQHDCQYCFLQLTGWNGKAPEQLYTPDHIVRMLTTHPLFHPHETPLCFGNQTDPLLAVNLDYVTTFLRLLDGHKLRNPLVFITKRPVSDAFLQIACSVTSLRVVFFVSYSRLPSTIERGVSREQIETNFRKLADAALPVIHYWRPLMWENSDADTLEAVLDTVAPHALASVWLGLRLSPALNRLYASRFDLTNPLPLHGDYVPDGMATRLRNLLAQKYPNYPLYKHASCALTLALGEPDFNATMHNENICGMSNCPDWKRQLCKNAKHPPSEDRVKQILDDMDIPLRFRLSPEAVCLDGEISQDQYCALLHRLKFPLRAGRVHYNQLMRGTNMWPQSTKTQHKGEHCEHC